MFERIRPLAGRIASIAIDPVGVASRLAYDPKLSRAQNAISTLDELQSGGLMDADISAAIARAQDGEAYIEENPSAMRFGQRSWATVPASGLAYYGTAQMLTPEQVAEQEYVNGINANRVQALSPYEEQMLRDQMIRQQQVAQEKAMYQEQKRRETEALKAQVNSGFYGV